MAKNKITALTLAKKFNFEIMNKKDIKEYKEITSPAIYRAGLELNGHKISVKSQKNIIAWGTKESVWLKKQGGIEAEKKVEFVLKDNPPLILLSSGFKTEWTKEIIKHATKFQVPIAKLNISVTEINSTIGIYLLSNFAKSKSVHGSLVIVNGVGVLITGKSGVGKSEAVLELIQNNHTFVSDDTVIMKKIGNEIHGYPAEVTKHLLEARGIGIVDVQYIYGARSIKDSAKIKLVLELTETKAAYTFDRLGDHLETYEVLGVNLSKVFLPVKSGRTVSSLIEAATNVFLARKDGLDPLDKISKRSKGVE